MMKAERNHMRGQGRILRVCCGSGVMTTPQVPRYNPESVTAPADLSTPKVPALGADSFGAGLGEGIQRAASSVAGIVKDVQDKANASVVMQASNSSYGIEEELTMQAKRLTGKSAFGATDVLLHDFDERHGEIRMGLANDVQRAAFDKLLAARRHAFASTVLDHELKQTTGYTIGEATAATEGAAQRVGLYHDRPELFESSRQEMERNARAEMSIKGFGPDSEATKLRLAQLNSKVYEDQVQALLVKDPAAAHARFGELKAAGSFQGDAVERLEPKIQVYLDTKTAEDQGAAIFAKYQPKTVNDALPVDKMRQEARTFEGSDHVRSLIEKRVEGLVSDYLQQIRLNEEAASQRIFGLGKDKQTPYLELVREINGDATIDNKTKASLLDWADRTYGISEAKREARAEARAEARQQKNLAYMSNLLSFQDKYLNGDYGTMTPAQVTKHMKELGPFTDNAMQFVQHVNNDPAAKVTDEALKDTLRILAGDPEYKGLLPNVDKPSPEDKAKLTLLQAEVQSTMSAARKNDGPKSTMTVNKAVLQAIKKVTTDKGSWWNGGDTEEPLYLLGTNYATKYGKDPAKWTKETQDTFIKKQFYQANPHGKLTPQKVEEYRFRLLQEGSY